MSAFILSISANLAPVHLMNTYYSNPSLLTISMNYFILRKGPTFGIATFTHC